MGKEGAPINYKRASGLTALAGIAALASGCVRVESANEQIEGTVVDKIHDNGRSGEFYLVFPDEKNPIIKIPLPSEKDDEDFILVVDECFKPDICTESDIYVPIEIFDSTDIGDQVSFDLATQPEVSRTD